MSKKLYVGNLPFSITEERLKEIFSPSGTVENVKIIKDEIGRSKGFGFVEMTSEEEASGAASDLNGKEVDGRMLKVEVARPQEFKPRDRGSNGGGYRGGNDRKKHGGGGFRR